MEPKTKNKQVQKKKKTPEQKAKRKARRVALRQKRELKGDPRTAKNTETSIAVSTQQQAIPIEVPLAAEILYGVCLSYVDTAVSRGYLSRAPSGSYPYWASVYMLNVLIAYVRGSTPKASSLPIWLQDFGQALAPKHVKMGANGLAFYRFVLTASDDVVIPPFTPIGSGSYGYEHLYYEVGSGDVNMFPKASPPTAYTAANGAEAWSSLAQFMQDDNNPRSQVVALRESTWQKNVSAFAMPANAEGLGYTASFPDNGGKLFQANLEVPIHTPLLAVFANFLTNGSTNPFRYGNFVSLSSGDPLFASAMFHQLAPARCLGTKRPTMFHAIDFLWCADVLAKAATGWNRVASTDSQFTQAGGGAPEFTCPLTLQEFLLLLRNELMYAFGVTQPAVQSIYPRSPSSSNDNEFVPFLCSTNTVATEGTGMKLPILFVENMKSLLGRWVMFKNGKNDQFFCPILGKYNSDVLVSSDYSIQYGETTIPTFATSSGVMRKRRSSKGAVELIPDVEAPINLVDGSSSSDYVFINDATRLKTLCAVWNNWIERRAAYTNSLAVISRDLGVNVCCSIANTIHWIPTPQSYKERMSDVVDSRLAKMKELTSSVYSDRQQIGYSQRDKMLSPAFDNILNIWILPVNKAVIGGNAAQQSPFLRECIMSGETYSTSFATQDAGQSMAERSANFAAQMVHAPFTPPNAMEQFFIDQEKLAHGGVLSGLVAGFLGKAFGPNVGSIAGAVADVIPI